MDALLPEELNLEVKDALKGILFKHLAKDKTEINTPAVMFMAGSPAAGKTELLDRLVENHNLHNFVRIDADDFRWWFPYYNELNAVHFQKPASRMVDYIYQKALEARYQIIMDSTFASRGIAETNFERAFKAGYGVILNYVYFDPALAWLYAQKRKRLVPLEVLKKNFIKSREVIRHMLERYDGKFTLNVYYRYADHQHKNGFNVEFIDNVNKDNWLRSHHCPYNCIEDLSGVGV